MSLLKVSLDRLGIGLLCAAAILMRPERSPGGTDLVYVGTYSGEKSQGIYVSHFDNKKGTLSSPELAAPAKNSSFLALDPSKKFLFAVGETGDFGGKPSGSVSSFRIDKQSGKLESINQQSSAGAGPCHLAIDRTGKNVLVANYNSGNIAVLAIQKNGMLSEPKTIIQHHGKSVDPARQQGPYAHFIAPDPANRFVLVCDLGLDKVLVYKFEPGESSLQANDPPSASVKAGAGPRHLAFHPNGQVAYVINEMGSTITTFGYTPRNGALNEMQTVSTLPESFNGRNTCSEVQVHPSGKFIYGANRGHDSLAIFGVDSKTGKLTLIGHQATEGRTPRHFTLDPSGKWLLAENQDSNSIVVFAVDGSTGKLQPTGHSIEIGAPACAVFVP